MRLLSREPRFRLRRPWHGAISPLVLRLVERLVRRTQQRVDGGHADGRLGNADADREPELNLVDVEDVGGPRGLQLALKQKVGPVELARAISFARVPKR